MRMNKILLIEDEASLREAISFALSMEDYSVVGYASGKKAIEQENVQQYDVIILDVMLPEMNGWDVCKKIRDHSDVPILFLSVKGATTDRIKGLKLGGDDYLSKPFDMEELLLRISKQLPQTEETKDQILKLATAEIDFQAYTIQGLKGKVQIPHKEMEVLGILYEYEGKAVNKNLIQDRVWREKTFPGGRTLDNYILNLRKHIEHNPKKPKYLLTIRGYGYKLVVD